MLAPPTIRFGFCVLLPGSQLDPISCIAAWQRRAQRQKE